MFTALLKSDTLKRRRRKEIRLLWNNVLSKLWDLLRHLQSENVGSVNKACGLVVRVLTQHQEVQSALIIGPQPFLWFVHCVIYIITSTPGGEKNVLFWFFFENPLTRERSRPSKKAKPSKAF